MSNETLIEALIEIAEMLEEHPGYMPDATEDDLNSEGGDSAFITSLAQIARAALEAA